MSVKSSKQDFVDMTRLKRIINNVKNAAETSLLDDELPYLFDLAGNERWNKLQKESKKLGDRVNQNQFFLDSFLKVYKRKELCMILYSIKTVCGMIIEYKSGELPEGISSLLELDDVVEGYKERIILALAGVLTKGLDIY